MSANASDLAWRRETAALGMWVFLATEVLFFGVLFFASMHARLHDPRGFAVASHLTHAGLGTINTAILLTSSFTMALAVRAAWIGERKALRLLLWATAAFGLAFLGVKVVEYALEWRDGLVPVLKFTYAGERAAAVQAFFYLYFVMTGVHAIHLAIGIGVVVWLALGAASAPSPRGPSGAGLNAEGWGEAPIEMAGLYWHFVDAVWIFLYPVIYLVELWR